MKTPYSSVLQKLAVRWKSFRLAAFLYSRKLRVTAGITEKDGHKSEKS